MSMFIYAAQGQKILKVGKTSNPVTRKSSLKRDFAKFDDQISNFVSFDVNDNGYFGESRLLESVASSHKRYMGREWFSAGDFDAVKKSAERIAAEAVLHKPFKFKKPTKAQIDADEKATVDRRAKMIADREAWKAKHAQKVKERRTLRLLRRLELDCIAMWKRIAPAQKAEA